MFKSVFLTCPLVLGNFLIICSIFFSRFCLAVSYCVLGFIELVPGTVVSIAFIFGTNLSYIAFLTASLCTTLLSLVKTAETVFSLSTSISCTSAFKLAKSYFAARLDASIWSFP